MISVGLAWFTHLFHLLLFLMCLAHAENTQNFPLVLYHYQSEESVAWHQRVCICIVYAILICTWFFAIICLEGVFPPNRDGISASQLGKCTLAGVYAECLLCVFFIFGCCYYYYCWYYVGVYLLPSAHIQMKAQSKPCGWNGNVCAKNLYAAYFFAAWTMW